MSSSKVKWMSFFMKLDGDNLYDKYIISSLEDSIYKWVNSKEQILQSYQVWRIGIRYVSCTDMPSIRWDTCMIRIGIFDIIYFYNFRIRERHVGDTTGYGLQNFWIQHGSFCNFFFVGVSLKIRSNSFHIKTSFRELMFHFRT